MRVAPAPLRELPIELHAELALAGLSLAILVVTGPHLTGLGGLAVRVLVAIAGVVALLAAARRLGATSVARDVEESERRRLQLDLEHRVSHDELTGLASRSTFTDHTQRSVAAATTGPTRPAVLVVDLHGFKAVNDTLGYLAGDRLLTEVADRLRRSVAGSDTVARLGGDEFAVLLADVGGRSDAVQVAERVLAAIRRPIELDGLPTHVEASVGIAVSSGSETAAQLLRNADVALDSATQAGAGRYEVFDHDVHRDAIERLELERDLAAAIGTEQLVVHYQPIVNLDDEQVVGVEALTRWEHPERGELPAGRFVSLAEESGLIVPLGRWMLTTACQQVAAWQRRYRVGPEPLRLSIDISSQQLLSGDLVADVARALKASDLDPGSLTLEISEPAVIQDADAALHTLRELKYLGVQLAIDDVGTGTSVLSHLQRFPFDELKIDRSFIAGLAAGSPDTGLVRAMIDMGRSLRLRTVAGGIEDAEQALRVRRLRCELGQGPLFAQAGSAEATERLLATRVPAVLDDLVIHVDLSTGVTAG